MLETEISGDNSTGAMPFVRRKRQHLSSTRTNQIEVHGTTYLCFPDDHTWFQGNINTDDESSYSLYGERVSPDPTETEQKISPTGEENNNNSDKDNDHNKEGDNEKSSGDLLNSHEHDYYKVTLTDHFTGLSYHLPKIGVNPKSTLTGSPVLKNGSEPDTGDDQKDTNLFICSDADVKFSVEHVYKGQKADMVIQKNLGSSSLLGQKCLVYTGPISIVFNEVIETGRSWCL